jgi:hypothetical protein
MTTPAAPISSSTASVGSGTEVAPPEEELVVPPVLVAPPEVEEPPELDELPVWWWPARAGEAETSAIAAAAIAIVVLFIEAVLSTRMYRRPSYVGESCAAIANNPG